VALVDIQVILIQLFVLVLLAQVAAYLCGKARIPVVIGEILVGIAISNIFLNGSSLFSLLGFDQVASQIAFQLLATLGVIFLLFAVGLETPFSELKKVGKVATIVALVGVILPFIGGLLLMVFWGTSMIVSLFVAAALVATSVGVTARVIKDLGLMDTIEARVIIAAAVIDDILGLIVLAMVSGVAQGGAINLVEIAVVAGLAVGFVLLTMFISVIIPRARTSPQVTKFIEKRKPAKRMSLLPFALIVCFGLSALASYLNLAAIVGAFLAGMIFAEFRDIWNGAEKFEPINEFLVPFFFLYVGVQFNVAAFGTASIIILTILLTIVAIITKFAGCAIGAKSLGARSATIVGVGMIPRGEVGITVAFIGFTTGVLTADLYATIIAMALITTLIAPWLLFHTFKQKNKPRLKKMKTQKEF